MCIDKQTYNNILLQKFATPLLLLQNYHCYKFIQTEIQFKFHHLVFFCLPARYMG